MKDQYFRWMNKYSSGIKYSLPIVTPYLEVRVALDSPVVFPFRLVEYHADPFARRESRVTDVGYHALTLLHGHLDTLTDFE